MRFHHLSVGDGLSQLNVTSLLQDRQGYLWMGTRSGLNRYNGVSFDVFRYHDNFKDNISSNNITCLAEDRDQVIWVGTVDGLNKLDKRRSAFIHYFPFSRTLFEANRIYSLCVDDNNTLWVGTGKGLFIYDRSADTLVRRKTPQTDNRIITGLQAKGGRLYISTAQAGFHVYDIAKNKVVKSFRHTADPRSITEDYVRAFCVDAKGNMWLGMYKNGINYISADGRTVRKITTADGLSDDNIRCIRQSKTGEIWVGTYNGVNVIQPSTWQIKVYNQGSLGNLSHNSIYDILFDNTNTVWIGTYAGGVSYLNNASNIFRFYNPSQTLERDLGILGPAAEKAGTLYICSEGGGLVAVDRYTKKANVYRITPSGDAKDNLKSICRDGNDILCGTSDGRVYKFDTGSKTFTLLYQLPEKRPVYHISKSRSGQYLLGAIGHTQGFSIVSPDWKTAQMSFPVKGGGNVSFRDVLSVCELNKGIYLVGTKNKGLYYYNKVKRQLISYRERGYFGHTINSIARDHTGRVWVGSEMGLSELDVPHTKVKTYGDGNGLQSSEVCKVVEGNDNAVWFTTLNGISRIDLATRGITNYDKKNGIVVQEFSQCGGYRMHDGTIFFSGNNGFEVFNPRNIVRNSVVPPVVIDKLFLDNKIVLPEYKNDILKEGISFQKKIVLNYNQNNIILEYCALNYVFSDRNQYMYMLKGLDKDWNNVGNRRSAFYTNIPPGKYTFMVKGANNDGVWNDTPTTLEIEVLSPPWRTWWAYAIYALIVGTAVYMLWRHYDERRKLHSYIKLRKIESDIHERYYQERNNLFTNFSHELRTPLTLIKAPLEDLARKADIGEETQSMLSMMMRNVKRMMELVNNLMDLQKNESGSLRLHLADWDFVKLSHESVMSFRDLAMYRNVTLGHKSSVGQLPLSFDRGLMEKVFFNLLSNAFKHTPENGSVEVTISVKHVFELSNFAPAAIKHIDRDGLKYVCVTVHNTGSHINADELEKIFKPFYQATDNKKTGGGSGIGLSLSKAIISLHHGALWAENTEDGVMFKFILPDDKEVFANDNVIMEQPQEEVSVNFEVGAPEEAESDSGRHGETILVVEDNRDLNKYICSCLSDKYNVKSAYNGEDGLAKALNNLPDLVITDVMMPKMNGMELCEKLKNNVNTSHIPVIILTAKTTQDDIREGLSTGADSYITKPFDSSILRTRVKNLIQNRERLKKRYSKEFSLETLGVDLTPLDEKFMQKLYTMMKENLSNSDMDLEAFCGNLGMSKSNCYRKIKHLTGMSPNEFIRKFRLDMAAKMLVETDKSITDIYMAVGFSSPAYFSNCFRTQFGSSPSVYKNNSKKQS